MSRNGYEQVGMNSVPSQHHIYQVKEEFYASPPFVRLVKIHKTQHADRIPECIYIYT